MAKVLFRETRDKHGSIVNIAKVRIQFSVSRRDFEDLLFRYFYEISTELFMDISESADSCTRECLDDLLREQLRKDGSATLDYGGVSRDPARDRKAQIVREFVRNLLIEFYPEFHAEFALEALELSVGNQKGVPS